MALFESFMVAVYIVMVVVIIIWGLLTYDERKAKHKIRRWKKQKALEEKYLSAKPGDTVELVVEGFSHTIYGRVIRTELNYEQMEARYDVTFGDNSKALEIVEDLESKIRRDLKESENP